VLGPQAAVAGVAAADWGTLLRFCAPSATAGPLSDRRRPPNVLLVGTSGGTGAAAGGIHLESPFTRAEFQLFPPKEFKGVHLATWSDQYNVQKRPFVKRALFPISSRAHTMCVCFSAINKLEVDTFYPCPCALLLQTFICAPSLIRLRRDPFTSLSPQGEARTARRLCAQKDECGCVHAHL